MRARGLASPLFDAVGKSITIESAHPSRIRTAEGLCAPLLPRGFIRTLYKKRKLAAIVGNLFLNTAKSKRTTVEIFFPLRICNLDKGLALCQSENPQSRSRQKDLKIVILLDDLYNYALFPRRFSIVRYRTATER